MFGPVSFMFIFVIGIIATAIVFSVQAARKRREALHATALRLGLAFVPDRDPTLAQQFAFLNKLARGLNRYAYNRLHGRWKGHPIQSFDYHYETHSTDSKGRSQTDHHHFSVLILSLEKAFPELTICREGFFSKIAQAVGFADIDFESTEFSKRFCVRSKNKKFAYDFCNAQMIEHLLTHQDLDIEVEGNALALAFARCLRPEEIEPHLEELVQIRLLMPNYLFES